MLLARACGHGSVVGCWGNELPLCPVSIVSYLEEITRSILNHATMIVALRPADIDMWAKMLGSKAGASARRNLATNRGR